MIYVRFTVVLGLLAAVWAQSLPAHGEAFRLSVAVDSQRRPTLSMSGLTAGRYLLEASTNLSQWFSVMSAPAGTGAFSFVHSEAAQLGTVFYRGRQLPELIAIVPQVDSNQVASGLITMDTGGRSHAIGDECCVVPVSERNAHGGGIRTERLRVLRCRAAGNLVPNEPPFPEAFEFRVQRGRPGVSSDTRCRFHEPGADPRDAF